MTDTSRILEWLDGVRGRADAPGLDILFSGDGPDLTFVEVERRDTHESVRWGQWLTRTDGLHVLVVPRDLDVPALEAALRAVVRECTVMDIERVHSPSVERHAVACRILAAIAAELDGVRS